MCCRNLEKVRNHEMYLRRRFAQTSTARRVMARRCATTPSRRGKWFRNQVPRHQAKDRSRRVRSTARTPDRVRVGRSRENAR